MGTIHFQVTVTQPDDPSKDWEGRLSAVQLLNAYPWLKAIAGNHLVDIESLDLKTEDGRLQIERIEEPEDPGRSEIFNNPIASHHPDCQCERCRIGDDSWLWLHHPEEY